MRDPSTDTTRSVIVVQVWFRDWYRVIIAFDWCIVFGDAESQAPPSVGARTKARKPCAARGGRVTMT